MKIVVMVNGQPKGPLELDALKAELQAGRVSPTALAWHEGREGWIELQQIPEAQTALYAHPAAIQDASSEPSSVKWYYLVGDQTRGPSSTEEIRALLSAGSIPPSTFVFSEGMKDWAKATTLHEFQALTLSNATATTPPHSKSALGANKPRRRMVQTAVLVLLLLAIGGITTTSLVNHRRNQQIALKAQNSTKLTQAARASDLAAVQNALANGADVNAATESGETALMFAVENGSVDMVTLLLGRGANINAKADNALNSYTALHKAKSVEIITLLLQKGADPRVPYTEGRPRLIQYLRTGNGHPELQLVELVDLFLTKGADPNATEKDGYTSLMAASLWKGDKAAQAARLLINKGANVNAKKDDGMTALHLATINNQLELVRCLVTNGADQSAKAQGGFTALDITADRPSLLEIRKVLGGHTLAEPDTPPKSGSLITDSSAASDKDVFSVTASSFGERFLENQDAFKKGGIHNDMGAFQRSIFESRTYSFGEGADVFCLYKSPSEKVAQIELAFGQGPDPQLYDDAGAAAVLKETWDACSRILGILAASEKEAVMTWLKQTISPSKPRTLFKRADFKTLTVYADQHAFIMTTPGPLATSPQGRSTHNKISVWFVPPSCPIWVAEHELNQKPFAFQSPQGRVASNVQGIRYRASAELLRHVKVLPATDTTR